MATLTAGSKAYFDSFNGLVPCKVISVERDGKVTIELTADRGAYNRGEYIVSNTRHVVPREAVRIRNGQYRIGVYGVEVQS